MGITRTVTTPVITEYAALPTDTTFTVLTVGQAIPRVDAKLQGKDSKFTVYDASGLSRDVVYGDPDFEALYRKYLADFKNKQSLGLVEHQNSFFKRLKDAILPDKKQNGGIISYAEYLK